MSRLHALAAELASHPLVTAILEIALEEDIGAGDVTTATMVPETAQATARIVAREAGVVAGFPIARRFVELAQLEVQIEAQAKEGEAVQEGQIIARLTGSARGILTLERGILNLLQRLSGVATTTAKYVAAVAGTKAHILETRKTIPGWRQLDKYAVLAGGGENHRMGLFDQILAKENHFALCPGADFAAKIHYMMKERPAGIAAEVEVENSAEFKAALAGGVELILLDNMSLADMRQAVLDRDASQSSSLLEASGGITMETLRAVAETGVDRISIGALTHSVKALDLSLLVDL